MGMTNYGLFCIYLSSLLFVPIKSEEKRLISGLSNLAFGLIIAVIGAFVIAVIVLGMCCYKRRRETRKRKTEPKSDTSQAFKNVEIPAERPDFEVCRYERREGVEEKNGDLRISKKDQPPLQPPIEDRQDHRKARQKPSNTRTAMQPSQSNLSVTNKKALQSEHSSDDSRKKVIKIMITKAKPLPQETPPPVPPTPAPLEEPSANPFKTEDLPQSEQKKMIQVDEKMLEQVIEQKIQEMLEMDPTQQTGKSTKVRKIIDKIKSMTGKKEDKQPQQTAPPPPQQQSPAVLSQQPVIQAQVIQTRIIRSDNAIDETEISIPKVQDLLQKNEDSVSKKTEAPVVKVDPPAKPAN